jgi:adenine-specific DNA-methyltransferase
MPRGKKTGAKPTKRPITQYEHRDKKRINNPPVGLVTSDTDPPVPTHKAYEYAQPVPTVKPGKNLDYDPHLDPQLVWAGKKEHTSFEVPTVSLHVHERIDPHTIIGEVRKKNGDTSVQPSLFEQREQNPPLREAIDFYRHSRGWSNRLIAGDSLLVMNSLLEKEGMAGQVQMVYMDPPYGVKYGSNFQPFVNNRDVKDGKDVDLTQEPEMIRAFRDTWELGIHSYLGYLRDRLLLSRELLHESGSCFVQISDVNLHRVRDVMEDVFGSTNFAGIITFRKTSALTSGLLAQNADYLLWFGKNREKLKYRQLFVEKGVDSDLSFYAYVELATGERRRLTTEEIGRPVPKDARLYSVSDLTSSHEYGLGKELFQFQDTKYSPGARYWTTSPDGMKKIAAARRIHASKNSLRYVRYFDDFPYQPVTANWTDTVTGQYSEPRIYVVQTATKVVSRCILMTTDPGDLVFDPTCGSGTTAHVAEDWGRRWITCDTSRVAITLAKQRLMVADFDYYELAHREEGVGSGFRFKAVPHVTLKSIANNPEISEGMTREEIEAAVARYAEQETLYDEPEIDKSRVRVTGPFTVEAVPAPTIRSLDEITIHSSKSSSGQESLSDLRQVAIPLLDTSVSRSGATLRHAEWRDELLKTGLRGKGGHHIDFSRVEPLAGTRWLHAEAETKGVKPECVAISFGPEHSLLEQRQVELAWEEVRTLNPKPSILVFAAFEFDPEAAKDIDGMTREKICRC